MQLHNIVFIVVSHLFREEGFLEGKPGFRISQGRGKNYRKLCFCTVENARKNNVVELTARWTYFLFHFVLLMVCQC